MPAAAFRLYFGERPATAEELARVDEITVEQEADMAWEARIRMTLCTAPDGRWQHRPDQLAAPFSRVRIELQLGSAGFVALIDGPVAAFEHALDSLPGRSSATLVVRDDSVLMNRSEAVETFENRSDDAIARELFGRFAFIASTRIEAVGSARAAVVRRGSEIAFLRRLARAHGRHAYVLPGSARGQSVGCFLPDPSRSDGLPPLVLLGSGRNLTELELHEDSEAPGSSSGRTLHIVDGQIQSAQSGPRDLTLLRPLPPLAGASGASRLLRPEDDDRDDPGERTTGDARQSAWAYRASGKLVAGCYAGVLAPYRRVPVEAGDLPLSGEWLIAKVTHHITPSVYTQQFEALADSLNEPGAPAPDGGAGGLSVSLSASLSIF